MLLDDGKLVYFGQHIRDAERIFSCVAVDNPLRSARKGVDKQIRAGFVRLDFDSELLKQIEFREGYTFKHPPKPFTEPWKNFVVIEDQCTRAGMTREEFESYLRAWEKRAQELGARRRESGDLGEAEYRMTMTRDAFFNDVHISMGPSRRASGGGIWADDWHVFFSVDQPVATLKTVSAFCDQVNTIAR